MPWVPLATTRPGKKTREVGVVLSRVSEDFALMENGGAMALSNEDDDMLMDSEGSQGSDGR